LNPDILKKVKNEIFHSNKRKLQRSESINKIKFPKKILNADDILIRVPKKVKTQNWTNSKPNLLDFELYKKQNNYNLTSEKYMDDEREWVRAIWNEWFDEVIPQYDGTGGRPSSSFSSHEKEASEKMKGSSFNATPVTETTFHEEDEEEKKRNAVSPTPYTSYSQVDLAENENTRVDLEALKILEKEIEKITLRLKNKMTAFDLSRRGTLYRKVSFFEIIQKAFEPFQNFYMNSFSKFSIINLYCYVIMSIFY
jgi:hypothetical protein